MSPPPPPSAVVVFMRLAACSTCLSTPVPRLPKLARRWVWLYALASLPCAATLDLLTAKDVRDALAQFRTVAAAPAPAPAPAAAAAPSEGTTQNWIVITTIAPPTTAIKLWAALPGWRVVVVADGKTPSNWSWPNVTFLSVQDQMASGFLSAAVTPFANYARKNIGFLHAIRQGAKLIYETDDDNAPSAQQGLDWVRLVAGTRLR